MFVKTLTEYVKDEADGVRYIDELIKRGLFGLFVKTQLKTVSVACHDSSGIMQKVREFLKEEFHFERERSRAPLTDSQKKLQKQLPKNLFEDLRALDKLVSVERLSQIYKGAPIEDIAKVVICFANHISKSIITEDMVKHADLLPFWSIGDKEIEFIEKHLVGNSIENICCIFRHWPAIIDHFDVWDAVEFAVAVEWLQNKDATDPWKLGKFKISQSEKMSINCVKEVAHAKALALQHKRKEFFMDAED